MTRKNKVTGNIYSKLLFTMLILIPIVIILTLFFSNRIVTVISIFSGWPILILLAVQTQKHNKKNTDKYSALLSKAEEISELHHQIYSVISCHFSAFQEIHSLKTDCKTICNCLQSIPKLSFHSIQEAEDYIHQLSGLRQCIQENSENIIKDALPLKEQKDRVYRNIAIFIYSFANSIPILSDLAVHYKNFSQDVIIEIINEFGKIQEESSKINDEMHLSFSEIMDQEKKDSLAYIVKRIEFIRNEFEGFTLKMDNLKESSNQFVAKTNVKLNDIAKIAKSIEEIAETVRVIALNVSVEAANTGESGKGFKVLSRDLSEFAGKTINFSKEVSKTVTDTLNTTKTLESEYLDNMNRSYNTIHSIEKEINHFSEIINHSFNKIKDMETNQSKLSNHILFGLRDVITKLQNYDISKQEIEHLSNFVEKLFVDLYNNYGSYLPVSEFISDEEKNKLREDILLIIHGIITTANERELLTKYENIYGIKVQKDYIIQNMADDSINQGDDDDIIIF